jgi:hypothetical protein
MVSYDYSQLPHITLPPQESLYTSMITYPIHSNGGNFEG